MYTADLVISKNYAEEKINGLIRPSYSSSIFDDIQKSLIPAAPPKKLKTIKGTAVSRCMNADKITVVHNRRCKRYNIGQ